MRDRVVEVTTKIADEAAVADLERYEQHHLDFAKDVINNAIASEVTSFITARGTKATITVDFKAFLKRRKDLLK